MSSCCCSKVGLLAHWLVLIGALNWGLVGLGSFLNMNLNIVNLVIGNMPQLEWVVYILVGLSAIYKIFASCKCKA